MKTYNNQKNNHINILKFFFYSLFIAFVYTYFSNLNIVNKKDLASTYNILSDYGIKTESINISFFPVTVTLRNISLNMNKNDKVNPDTIIKSAVLKETKPSLKGFQVKLNVSGVSFLSGGKIVKIPEISLNSKVQDNIINVSDLKVSALKGNLVGGFDFNTISNSLNGDFNFKSCDLSLLENPDININKGNLSGTGNFDINIDNLESLNLTSSFTLKDAIIKDSALAGSVIGILHGNIASAGTIKVSKINADINIKNGLVNIENIKAKTSSADASGKIKINKKNKVDGTLSLTGLKGLTGETVYVKGKVGSIVVIPSAGTTAGAVAGSVLAGPVGTVVGAKIGSVVEGVVNKIGKSLK